MKNWEVRFKRRSWEVLVIENAPDNPEQALRLALERCDKKYEFKDVLGMRQYITLPKHEIERLRGLK